jgi:hypothetical protein
MALSLLQLCNQFIELHHEEGESNIKGALNIEVQT